MQSASPSLGSQLALVQLPVRMRRALKLFRKITGLTAVTSIATSLSEAGTVFALTPPVHPRCAEKLRMTPDAPCGEQWMIHVRSSRRSPRMHSHVCPLGLRCSCVPIHFGKELVGVAKLVVDADTPGPALKTALSVLRLVVSETCQGFAVSVLSEEVGKLRNRVTELQQIRSPNRAVENLRGSNAAHGTSDSDVRGAALVERALAHLGNEFRNPKLSLRSVASALRCNPRYLTGCFTRLVGEHMHAHLVTLRVSHASRLLTTTDLTIKQVALGSGFSGSRGLAGAFRTHVGVSPGAFRKIFSRA